MDWLLGIGITAAGCILTGTPASLVCGFLSGGLTAGFLVVVATCCCKDKRLSLTVTKMVKLGYS